MCVCVRERERERERKERREREKRVVIYKKERESKKKKRERERKKKALCLYSKRHFRERLISQTNSYPDRSINRWFSSRSRVYGSLVIPKCMYVYVYI